MNKTTSERPSLTDRSVLITGGAGFIGSHLADRLVETCNVRILDDFSGGDREDIPQEAEIIEGDIRDDKVVAESLSGVDVVFHEAALVSVTESVERPAETHDVNLDATLQLFEQARTEDTRVVLASSTAIYGEPTSLPVGESDPKNPSSPYGLDKLAADHYARLYHELYGLETVALRYFNVYGTRQRSGQYGGVISIFVDQTLSGGPITVHGDGTQTRDFVYVQDVVDANIHAAMTDATGEAFNVGTGTETSIIELAEIIRETANSDVDIVHESARPGDIDRSRADITKAEENLGFSPSVSIEAGIKELVRKRNE